LAHITVAVTALASAAAASEPPMPGNVLVSHGQCCWTEFFTEYRRDGAEVRRVGIEPGPTFEPNAQDLAVDDAGRVAVVNGVGWVSLSTWDAAADSWSHTVPDEWMQSNVSTYGGIAVLGTRVFATDAGDGGNNTKSGILVYDHATDSWQRIAEDISPHDLNLGLDGLLYALHPSSPPGGRFVDVYDPDTLSFVRRIDLGAAIGGPIDNRTLAADRRGDLFIGTWNGLLHHVDVSGQLVASFTPNCPGESTGICHVSDIDISKEGELVFTTRGGDVLFTDTAFSYLEGFRLPFYQRTPFVTWVPKPPVEVEIDFKPGSAANFLALPSSGKVWVALFGNQEVAVEDVLFDALALGPGGARAVQANPRPFDLNADGRLDLLVAFRTNELGLVGDETEICLGGSTESGVDFEGCDAIQIVGGCGHGAELAWVVIPVALWSRRGRGRPTAGRSRRLAP
jgi:hypothetical protein